jgi:hypothetical protein
MPHHPFPIPQLTSLPYHSQYRQAEHGRKPFLLPEVYRMPSESSEEIESEVVYSEEMVKRGSNRGNAV